MKLVNVHATLILCQDTAQAMDMGIQEQREIAVVPMTKTCTVGQFQPVSVNLLVVATVTALVRRRSGVFARKDGRMEIVRHGNVQQGPRGLLRHQQVMPFTTNGQNVQMQAFATGSLVNAPATPPSRELRASF